MHSTQGMLVAVTGSDLPYVFDMPHLLSLPNGFEFRFRYRPRWVSQAVQEEVDDVKARKALVGQSLLVLFHSRETKRLVPLRLCTVLSLERLGPLLFLRFKVGAVVRVTESVMLGPDQDDTRRKEADRLTSIGRALLGEQDRDLSSALPEGLYLSRANSALKSLSYQSDTGDQSWAAMAALVMDEPNLAAMPMFRFLGFQQSSGTFLSVADIRGGFTVSKQPIGGYKLVEGERYRARLLQWRTGSTPLYRVACDVNPDALRVEGKSDLVVGKYDILEFAVMAERRGYSELYLRVQPALDALRSSQDGSPAPPRAPAGRSAAEWPHVYTARVPVVVRNNRVKVLLLGGAALAGFVLYAASASIVDGVLSLVVSLVSIQKPPADFAVKATQVAGLALMFLGFGDFLERVLGIGEKVRSLSGTGLGSGGK